MGLRLLLGSRGSGGARGGSGGGVLLLPPLLVLRRREVERRRRDVALGAPRRGQPPVLVGEETSSLLLLLGHLHLMRHLLLLLHPRGLLGRHEARLAALVGPWPRLEGEPRSCELAAQLRGLLVRGQRPRLELVSVRSRRGQRLVRLAQLLARRGRTGGPRHLPRGLRLPVLGQPRRGVDVGVDFRVVLLEEGLNFFDAALLEALVLLEERGVLVLVCCVCGVR